MLKFLRTALVAVFVVAALFTITACSGFTITAGRCTSDLTGEQVDMSFCE